MGWLEDIKRKAAGTVGKVLSYTPTAIKNLAPKLTVASTLQNYGGNKSGSLLSAIVPQAYASDMPATNYSDARSVQMYSPIQNTSNPTARTSGGGGGVPGDLAATEAPAEEGTNEYDQWRAEEERKAQARRQLIIGRLNLMKEEGQRQKQAAADQYTFSTGEVNKNYDALGGIAKDKLANSLNALTQEDVGVQNDYGRLAGNSRKAMESALTRNRMLFRAQGGLGSSFYNDAQGNTTNQGMNAVNDVGLEETDKRAAIKGRTSDTQTFFDQKGLEIEGERTGLLQQALRERKEADAAADLMQKEYGMDSEEQLQQNEYEFNSALNSIKDYIQNKSQKLAEIAAYNKTSGAAGSAVNSFAWKDPATESVLNKNEGQSSALAKIAALNSNTNAYPMSSGGQTVMVDQYGRKIAKQPADPNSWYINDPYAMN